MGASAEDDAAIRQCQAGDITGLARLAERHQVGALRLAYLLTGSSEAAQDIVQDGFIGANRSIHQFRLGQPFAPWFQRIIMNLARQHLRSAQQRHERSLQAWLATEDGDADIPDRGASPEALSEQRETRHAVLAALDDLTTRQREVIILRYYLGYDDGSIADLLRIPANTVRQRLHAARGALQMVIRRRYPWLIDAGWDLPTTAPSLAEEK